MPRLHKAIDHETGEVYHIETTRQAKRRYQKSGAVVPKPTAGQINAADIWNKQEEKIKKDRERDEKRKKNKLKQEARDAKQREVQEQLLREGRIRVEDTWGKVNASQNRLHKFFGVPEIPAETALPIVEEDAPRIMSQASANHATVDSQKPKAPYHSLSFLDDLEDVFTDLLPSQSHEVAENQAKLSFAAEQTAILCDNVRSTLDSPVSSKRSSKRKRLAHSQGSMAPPKRLRPLSSSSHRFDRNLSEEQSATAQRSEFLMTPPSPLKTMTDLQINLRGTKSPRSCDNLSPRHSDHFVATQVVNDTLFGLSSQDLIDDFTDEDDKENQLFTRSRIEGTSERRVRSIASQKENVVKTKIDGMDDTFEDSGFDEFDDGGIDDESLLSAAATQHLKKDLITSPKRRNHNDKRSDDDDWLSSPIDFDSIQCPPALAPQLGDSFATDGINDDDLLRKLEDFENSDAPAPDRAFSAKVVDQANLSSQPILPKRRRVLPWVKDPICFDILDEEIGYLSPSLASQTLDE